MFTSKSEIKTIRQGDPNFHICDGMVMYPRAMIHILPDCPLRVRETINWAFEQGYLKTAAHVKGKELTWETLTA